MSAHPRKKLINALLVVVLAGLLVLILWLTLFSRIGSESRHFYPPFWSYKAIVNGSGKALLEDVGNIVLFIPIGVEVSLFLGFKSRYAVLVGFTISLIVECCQWFFWLGSFEVDDLLHNSMGALIGSILINHTPWGLRLREQIADGKKSLIAFLSVSVLLVAMIFGYQELKWEGMKRLATLNDREDGTKNLLVLSPDPVYIGDTGFSVSFNSDGSIFIDGEANSRAWIEIGRVTLEPGTYSFSGLSGADEKTVAIELEYYDTDKGKYLRLTPDVGVMEEAEFVLQKKTKIRALIGIYPGAEGEYAARPVIYREE